MKRHEVRVLHVIDGLGGGGSERWVWDIVRLTDPRRFTHRVVTVHADRGEFVFAERLRARGVYRQGLAPAPVLWLRGVIDRLILLRRFTVVRKLLSALFVAGWYGPGAYHGVEALVRFRPDVIHAHTFDGLRAALLLKRLRHRPLVYTVPAQLSQMDAGGFGWMRKVFAREHDSIEVMFAGVSIPELVALGVPPERIRPIRGLVDLERTEAVRTHREDFAVEIRRRLELPADALILLSVGNFHPHKGQIFAIEALAKISGRRPNVYWVGLGNGTQRPILEKRAAELGITSRVRMPGFLDDPLPYYAAANLYVRTMVIEAENLSSHDAMAMGLPVVGFDTGTETELVRTAEHGLLVPNRDAVALASAIEAVLSMPDGGASLGRRAVEYARAHLDVRQAISDFEDAYTELGGAP